MAVGNGILDLTFVANGDLHDKIYYAVKKSTGTYPNMVELAGEGDPVLGVLQNGPQYISGGEGGMAIVRIYGVTAVQVGADDVAEGDQVSADASGLAQTAETTQNVFGIAIKSGSNSTGRLATVVLLPGKAS